jgi:hypothetical protein
MLAFPSFEMSLHVESGMSGGPVFDRPGHLRGIVCSSLQPDMVPSWASTLWPSMALPAEPRPNAHNGYDRLLHLARDGRLHALNIDRLRLPSDDADVRQWAIS